MSFAQQYEQDLAMGCVCDFDVSEQCKDDEFCIADRAAYAR